MVKLKWPWSKQTIEAGHAAIAGGNPNVAVLAEDSKGKQVTSYTYNKNEIRLPHPTNMGSYSVSGIGMGGYEELGNDPEASVALSVLTNIIAGVRYYTEMDEEYQPKKSGDPFHKNKQLMDKYGEAINLDEKLQVNRVKTKTNKH